MDIADRLRLDVPVSQAGMGGGVAGAPLTGAVAKAGGLGTLGLTLRHPRGTRRRSRRRHRRNEVPIDT
jgi:NAD(P)H-dependent flavin oxidoreductase YrpB (nitropropane dioxygenase family)